MRTSGSEATTMARDFVPPAATPTSSLYREHGELFGHPLTPRQREVLAAYARTSDRGKAAHALGITRNTLDNHLTIVYAKLGVASAFEALRVVGWLTIPPDLRAVDRHDRVVEASIDLHWALDAFLEWSTGELRRSA